MNDRPQSGNVSEKKAAAVSAVSLVRVGMVVGIGTGSTAAYAISKLGELVAGGLDIVGIPITTLLEHPEIDIVLDGADQIDQSLVAIKGGGGLYKREGWSLTMQKEWC
jgi:ribose 5-phosphate isomerase A